jgi:hypothetical protein
MVEATHKIEETDNEKPRNRFYPYNHALLCGILDIANTPVELATKFFLNKKISVSFCAGCAVGKHDNGVFSKDHESLAVTATRWVLAEQLGDWTAALITDWLQKNAEDQMDQIGQASIYVFGDAFRMGANHAAIEWGKKNGFNKNAPEVKTYADEKYSYEMKNISQAIVWTGVSTGTTLALLKLGGDKSSVSVNFAAKMTGSLFSSGVTLAMRALSPDTAQEWDNWANEHIAEPFTKVVGGMFGNKKEAVKTDSNKEWQGKIAEFDKQLAVLNLN